MYRSNKIMGHTCVEQDCNILLCLFISKVYMLCAKTLSNATVKCKRHPDIFTGVDKFKVTVESGLL